jgi:hypothetical protein
MQGLQLLLHYRLHGDGWNLPAPNGFEQRFGIRSIGLAAPQIRPDGLRRQQRHAMVHRLREPSSEKRGAAGPR